MCNQDDQIALSIKQKSPTSLHEAVSHTIQIESLLATCQTVNVASAKSTEVPTDAVNAAPSLDKFTNMIEKLGKRLDDIETTLQRPQQGNRRPLDWTLQ